MTFFGVLLSFGMGFVYQTLRGYEVKLIANQSDLYFQFGWSLMTALANGVLIYSVANDPRMIAFYAFGWASGSVVSNRLPIFKRDNPSIKLPDKVGFINTTSMWYRSVTKKKDEKK